MTAFELLARPCVCGHQRDAHQETTLSVPLEQEREPLYKLPNWCAIASSKTTGTYTSHECHCGCTSFTPDDDKTDYRP